MKGNEKSLLDKFKPFWQTGLTISEADKKMSFCLKNYAVNQIFAVFRANNSSLKENEKKEFESMVKELAIEKKAIGPDASCTAEEYAEFLKNSFLNVDDEDRNGEVTVKTSQNFRLLGDLIDVLIQWGPIPDEWAKRKKYCKFKAVDIFKSLKQGLVPKKGGPKEAEDEVSKELNDMMVDNKDKNNENTIKEKISAVDNKNNNDQFENININKINLNEASPKIVEIKKDISGDNFHNINFDLNDKKSLNNSGKRYTNDKGSIKNITSKPEDKSPKPNITPMNKDNEDNTNYNNQKTKPSADINVGNINQTDIKKNTVNTSDTLDLKRNINSSSLLSPDFKVDTKLTTRKMDFSFPVKFRGAEYFRLIDSVNKLIDTSSRDLEYNKVDKSLAQMELVLYYLHQVQR